MAAKKAKTRKKASKKKPTKKPVAKSKATPAAKSVVEETPSVEDLAGEAADEAAAIRQKLEDQNKELEELRKKLEEMPSGAPIVTGGPTDAELAKLAQEAEEEAVERAAERERQRVRAREERARDKERRRREQEAKRKGGRSNVASLADARAKQGSPSRPAPVATNPAVGKDEGPKPLQLAELYKYKLTVLNATYKSQLDRVKAPLVRKYNMMLKAELDALAAKDAECIAARKSQIECVNEIISSMGSQLPPGYAITQFRAEEGFVVAEYFPDRAGKPVPMPETVTDEG